MEAPSLLPPGLPPGKGGDSMDQPLAASATAVPMAGIGGQEPGIAGIDR